MPHPPQLARPAFLGLPPVHSSRQPADLGITVLGASLKLDSHGLFCSDGPSDHSAWTLGTLLGLWWGFQMQLSSPGLRTEKWSSGGFMTSCPLGCCEMDGSLHLQIVPEVVAQQIWWQALQGQWKK